MHGCKPGKIFACYDHFMMGVIINGMLIRNSMRVALRKHNGPKPIGPKIDFKALDNDPAVLAWK